MLIVGAKGFASEIFEDVFYLNKSEVIAFFDDLSLNPPELKFQIFSVIKTIELAKNFLKNNNQRFTIGVGKPFIRYKLYEKFKAIGGVYTSTISDKASVGKFDVEIGEGTNILNNAIISNTAKLGKGCLVYYSVIITHDCKIGHFVELSPNAILLGNVTVGDFSQIGSNATILPNVSLGKNVIIGAGSVVTKDIPDNCLALGIPAQIIKSIPPLDIYE